LHAAASIQRYGAGSAIFGVADFRGMGYMESTVVEVSLPNGVVALVRVADLDGAGGAAEKVGWKGVFDFDRVSGTLEGIAQAVQSAVEHAAPAKTTVELGIELAVKNGELTGLLVNGQAATSLKVTLEWTRSSPAVSGDD